MMCLKAAVFVFAVAMSLPGQHGPLIRTKVPVAGKPEFAPSIRVDVDLVLADVTVTGRDGRAIRGLERQDFEALEDGVPRTVVSVQTEEAPCSIGLVLDTSRSMQDKLGKAREAARAFFDGAAAGDEVLLVTFAGRPRLEQDFTTNLASVHDRLLAASADGATALMDAVSLALRRMRNARHARKALLLISDGGDNHSAISEKHLRNLVAEAGVQIHAIGIHDNPRSQEERSGKLLLDWMTGQTGGEHETIQNLADLPAAAARIGAALHDQYIVAFRPGPETPPDKWHKLQVRVKRPEGSPRVFVRARRGYYRAAR